MTAPLDTAAREVVELVLSGPPTLGSGRLLCIDGPSGAGKTSFARAVRRAAPRDRTLRVVHLDALYPGWDGLAEGVDRVGRWLLEPLSRDRPGRYRRYDWAAGREAGWVEVAPVDLLVLEGVGAGGPSGGPSGGDASFGRWTTTLVWLEAERSVRTQRALRRDGTATQAQLRAWWEQEDRWFAEHRTRERADRVVPNP